MSIHIDQNFLMQQLTSVRLQQATNLAGTYYNGAANNGVGATLTAAAAGALTIDSVATVAQDRVLLNGQTAGLQNGIYVVVNPGSASAPWILKRADDFANINQVQLGWFFHVYAGTTHAGSTHVIIEPAPIGDVGFGTITIS